MTRGGEGVDMSWKRWGIVRVSATLALLSTMMGIALFLGEDRNRLRSLLEGN